MWTLIVNQLCANVPIYFDDFRYSVELCIETKEHYYVMGYIQVMMTMFMMMILMNRSLGIVDQKTAPSFFSAGTFDKSS